MSTAVATVRASARCQRWVRRPMTTPTMSAGISPVVTATVPTPMSRCCQASATPVGTPSTISRPIELIRMPMTSPPRRRAGAEPRPGSSAAVSANPVTPAMAPTITPVCDEMTRSWRRASDGARIVVAMTAATAPANPPAPKLTTPPMKRATSTPMARATGAPRPIGVSSRITPSVTSQASSGPPSSHCAVSRRQAGLAQKARPTSIRQKCGDKSASMARTLARQADGRNRSQLSRRTLSTILLFHDQIVAQRQAQPARRGRGRGGRGQSPLVHFQSELRQNTLILQNVVVDVTGPDLLMLA